MSLLGPDTNCVCLGCRERATVLIDHDRHGERPVCEDCAEGHEVISHV